MKIMPGTMQERKALYKAEVIKKKEQKKFSCSVITELMG